MKYLLLAVLSLPLTAQTCPQGAVCTMRDGKAVVVMKPQTKRSVTGRPVVDGQTYPPCSEQNNGSCTFGTNEHAAWPSKGSPDKMNGTGDVDDPVLSRPFTTVLPCRYSGGVYSYTGHDRVTGQSRLDCSKAVEEWMMTPKK